jgi:hypothetical protein
MHAWASASALLSAVFPNENVVKKYDSLDQNNIKKQAIKNIILRGS